MSKDYTGADGSGYYARNRERCLVRQKAYYYEHRDKQLARQKEYYQRNRALLLYLRDLLNDSVN